MSAPEAAAAAVKMLNKVIKVAVAAGIGGSVLQTALFTGERRETWICVCGGMPRFSFCAVSS